MTILNTKPVLRSSKVKVTKTPILKSQYFHASPYKMEIGTVLTPQGKTANFPISEGWVYLTTSKRPHVSMHRMDLSQWYVYRVAPKGPVYYNQKHLDLITSEAEVVECLGQVGPYNKREELYKLEKEEDINNSFFSAVYLHNVGKHVIVKNPEPHCNVSGITTEVIEDCPEEGYLKAWEWSPNPEKVVRLIDYEEEDGCPAREVYGRSCNGYAVAKDIPYEMKYGAIFRFSLKILHVTRNIPEYGWAEAEWLK